MRKKAGIHPQESPECCKLLLEAGADVNSIDRYNVSPLGTACGTGGAKCIDMLVEYGANVNSQDLDGATPLHHCFFRGSEDCFERLIHYKPDASVQHLKTDIVAIDGAFRDNMHDILDYCLNNPEIRKIVGDDPNLSLTQDNVEKFLHRCLIFNAQDCLKVLLKHMKEVKTELKVNYAILIARAVTVYNHHRKD